MDLVPILPPRPLWTDRQLIAAADLTAEQTLQDARLARLRRFALGWGVVAGFEVQIAGAGLLIRSGYGFSPLGAEIYLAGDLPWTGVLADLTRACVSGSGPGCDRPARDGGPVDDAIYEAWIVARPETLVSCPRAHLPAGCATAGHDWAYSRQSGAIRVEVVCTLPVGLLPDARDCAAVQALLAGGDVPMPPDLPDLLPLAQVRFRVDGLIAVTKDTRRRLLPLSQLQAALACCDCADTDDGNDAPQNDTVNDTVNDTINDTFNDTVPDSVWDAPFDHLLGDLLDDFTGFIPVPQVNLQLRLEEVFDTALGPLSPGRGGFLKDPLQAFAAAALVTTAAGLRKWLAGDYAGIYETSRGNILQPLSTTQRLKPLGDLIADTPNIDLLRARHGQTPVPEVALIELGATRRDNDGLLAGGAAMLGFVQLRLQQMFVG